ncbi:MAG: hypothetical protein U0W40_20535 [Acidimicrobiia bacterium]
MSDVQPGRSHRVPRTWHDAYEDTQEFQALLRKYPTYQDAVDAWVRGERAPEHEGGNANPM